MIVNQPDRTGCTPLHYACLSGRLESVFLLLNAGANPVITNYDGRTPLHVCAAFRKIIIRPEKDHNRCDPPGWHHLIGDDDTLRMTEIIQLLRAHGADTLKSDQAGNTPFELAVDNGNQEMIAALHVDTANPLNPNTSPAYYLPGRLYWMSHNDSVNSIVDQLLDGKADIVKACHWLLKLGSYKIVEQLAARTRGLTVNPNVYKNTYTRGQYRDNQPIRSALHTLAEGQHWWNTDAMRFLLQRGANLDIRNPKGETPLHIAVKGRYRQFGMVQLLLEHGANPNVLDYEGFVPVNRAVQNSQMVRLLVQYGADLALGEHPVLYTAILSQDVETVRVIIEAGFDCQKPFKEHLPELLDEDDSDDDLGSHRFSRGSKPRSMRREKEEGDRNDLLSRPLHFACSSRFNNAAERYKAVAIVELLLAQACSPFLSCQEGTTIIHNVIHQGGILEPLLDLPDLNLKYRNEQGRTLLLAACQEENRAAWFVKRFDNLEKYPLPSVRRPQVIRQLCRMGADLDKYDHAENASLVSHFASQCQNLVLQRNSDGYEPFHLAAKGRIIGMLQPLLGAGANSREVEPDGNPVLHHLAIAIQKDRVGHTASIIDSFLRLGVDINAKNKAGESPLFSYVGAGSYETSLPVSSYSRKADGAVIKSFLEGGANLLTQNNEGENLLHVAAKLQCSHVGFPSIFAGDERYVDPFKYLMELGLDPFQEDNKQRTTVDVAAAYGNEAILALSQKK
ncbi:hypothetical protein ETB97_004915 [Aspergillus alliaceus]|uniref:Uncharacterized protein n=1 Tax=Petromyces alliaceus TaxID=209559 RepID=A0A8H5ZZG1_PETAA|nr:hypothetical protein ETB97_004915 [Aspergillus burnettii]